MAKLKIIGTSHIASQSVQEIKDVFRTDAPDIVALELDAQRARAIFEVPRTPKLKDAFKIGVMGYLFASVGGFIQRKFGSKVGMVPGEDMRTAILEARKHSLPLFLIDRPLELTLSALSKKMSAWEKCRLIALVGGSIFLPKFFFKKKHVKTVNLNEVPSDNLIDESINQIKDKFPGLYAALIRDRNRYMTRNIKHIIAKHPDKKILVVVGAGHKDSIEAALTGPAIAG